MKVGLYTVSPVEMVESFDGPWGDWEVEIEAPDGTLSKGYMQGDGHLFAEETLKDENGNEFDSSKVQ